MPGNLFLPLPQVHELSISDFLTMRTDVCNKGFGWMRVLSCEFFMGHDHDRLA
ncbi:hypothetical protein DY000_02053107 [Brassica cretica]|uniref:Uncharacterized protein n=1 Tax=Brassica cretica TaxID=69181 RepID=A0ABQ7AHF5_BRACR|nr:hypothetical protein DY000_02053107 [Brassica cretica]